MEPSDFARLDMPHKFRLVMHLCHAYGDADPDAMQYWTDEAERVMAESPESAACLIAAFLKTLEVVSGLTLAEGAAPLEAAGSVAGSIAAANSEGVGGPATAKGGHERLAPTDAATGALAAAGPCGACGFPVSDGVPECPWCGAEPAAS